MSIKTPKLWLWLVPQLLFGALAAQANEHVRGDFRFAVTPLPDWVEPAQIATDWDVAESGQAPWRYWLYDSQIDARGGRSAHFVDAVYESLSTELLGEAGRYEIVFRPEFQTLNLHLVSVRRDGEWVDKLKPESIELTRRQSKFESNVNSSDVSALIVIDDLRVGDQIRVAYTVDGANPVLEGHQYYPFSAAWSEPMLQIRGRVLFDPGTKILATGAGDPPEYQISDGESARIWSFAAGPVAPINDEDNTPIGYSPLPRWYVSRADSWQDIVSWALPLYSADQPLPAELEAKLQQWSKLPSVAERAIAALRLVQDEVRYFGSFLGDSAYKPGLPEQTWALRRGDCKDKTRLLLTLLKRLEIEAYPALVSQSMGMALGELPPSASAFDHVMVQARIDDQRYWLDPTFSGQRGDLAGSFPGYRGMALVVDRPTEALVKVLPPTDWHYQSLAEEHFYPSSEDGLWRLRVTTEYNGPSADQARARFAVQAVEQVQRDFRDYYARIFGEVESEGPPQITDEPDINRLVVIENYRLGDPLKALSSQLLALEPIPSNIGDAMRLPSTTARRAPLAFPHPWVGVYKAKVDLPDGWAWADSDFAGQISSPAFDFDYSMKTDAGAVVLEQQLHSKIERLEVAQTAEHIKALREAEDYLGLRIRLLKPGQVKVLERRERMRQAIDSLLAEPESK